MWASPPSNPISPARSHGVAATPRRYQRCYSKCFDPSGNKAKHPLGRPPADAMPTHKELEEFEDAHCRRGRAARVEEYE